MQYATFFFVSVTIYIDPKPLLSAKLTFHYISSDFRRKTSEISCSKSCLNQLYFLHVEHFNVVHYVIGTFRTHHTDYMLNWIASRSLTISERRCLNGLSICLCSYVRLKKTIFFFCTLFVAFFKEIIVEHCLLFNLCYDL